MKDLSLVFVFTISLLGLGLWLLCRGDERPD